MYVCVARSKRIDFVRLVESCKGFTCTFSAVASRWWLSSCDRFGSTPADVVPASLKPAGVGVSNLWLVQINWQHGLSFLSGFCSFVTLKKRVASGLMRTGEQSAEIEEQNMGQKTSQKRPKESGRKDGAGQAVREQLSGGAVIGATIDYKQKQNRLAIHLPRWKWLPHRHSGPTGGGLRSQWYDLWKNDNSSPCCNRDWWPFLFASTTFSWCFFLLHSLLLSRFLPPSLSLSRFIRQVSLPLQQKAQMAQKGK